MSNSGNYYTRRKAEEDLAYFIRGQTSGEFKAWLDERPKSVRDLCKKYPGSQFYRIKKDAPYSITVPGCVVAIQSYTEENTVRIRVLKGLDGKMGPDAFVDPQWLEPITLDVAFPEPN